MSEFVNNGMRRVRLNEVIRQFMDFRGRTPLKLGMEWGDGEIRALSANNVQMGRIDFSKDAYLGSDALYQRWMTKGDCEKGDVAFTTEAPLGNVAQIPDGERYILSQRVILLKANKALAEPAYLFQLFRSEAFQSELVRQSTGSTVLGIQQARLARVEVDILPLPQQRRIAEILSTVDEAIEQTEALIAKYQQIKAGLMQDLFTRGVALDGHLRPARAQAPHLYKESPLGWIPKAWSFGLLSDFLLGGPKNGYSPQEVSEWSGLYALGLGCLTGEGFKPNQLKVVGLGGSQCHQALLQDGDLLLSRSNTRELVGLCGIYRDVESPCIYPDLMMRIRPNGRTSAQFLEALLLSPLMRVRITSAAVGTSGSMVKLNSRAVLRLQLAMPEKDEQAHILKFIHTQRETLMSFECDLAKLRQQKQGLMQDLLTGRVRVKVAEAEEKI